MKRVGAPCELLHIGEMYAFIAKDETGNEGLAAFKSVDGWMPMVAADPARAESLKSVAQKMAETQGIEIQLCRFGSRAEIETFKGRKPR
jgi:hypothetical protein